MKDEYIFYTASDGSTHLAHAGTKGNRVAEAIDEEAMKRAAKSVDYDKVVADSKAIETMKKTGEDKIRNIEKYVNSCGLNVKIKFGYNGKRIVTGRSNERILIPTAPTSGKTEDYRSWLHMLDEVLADIKSKVKEIKDENDRLALKDYQLTQLNGYKNSGDIDFLNRRGKAAWDKQVNRAKRRNENDREYQKYKKQYGSRS